MIPGIVPGMACYQGWLSLREIDTAAGTRKGAAFRCFKRLEATLADGRDYIVLRADRDRDAISALRAQDRIYDSSVNVLLLSAAVAAHLAAALREQASVRR